MYILHLSILLTAEPSTTMYCCQQDPVAVLEPSLLGRALPPNPMWWVQVPSKPQQRQAQLQQDPLKLGPASTRTQQRWAQLPQDLLLLGIAISRTEQRWAQSCQQDRLKLGHAATRTQQHWLGLFYSKFRPAIGPKETGPIMSARNLGDPIKTRQSPLFFNYFFSNLETPLLSYFSIDY